MVMLAGNHEALLIEGLQGNISSLDMLLSAGFGSRVTLSTSCFLNFWLAVLIAPLIVGVIGMVIELTLLRRTYSIPPFYNLLLTFGIMIILQESVRIIYSSSGIPFGTPPEFSGGVDLGIIFFPKYRLFILVMATILASGTWLFLEKTKEGAIIRAGTDDSRMVDALGIDISKVFTLVFGIGTGLAGMAGALAAPVQNIFPYMGMNVVSDTMVIVIIGGMGSVFGSILGGVLIGELITVGVLIWPPWQARSSMFSWR